MQGGNMQVAQEQFEFHYESLHLSRGVDVTLENISPASCRPAYWKLLY